MSNANSTQVGGDHYKAHGKPDLQHWDMVAILALDYFQGNITKYLFRWRNKNGLQDLEKSRHYLEKYLEVIEAHGRPNEARLSSGVGLYTIIETFKLDYFQGTITKLVIWWRTKADIEMALSELDSYLTQVRASTMPAVLSAELDRQVREVEWDNGDPPNPLATDSNAHPAERSSQAVLITCNLCGGANGAHLPNCDRAIKPAMLYRGADEPLIPVDPVTLRPVQPASASTGPAPAGQPAAP
jgi:hypothetical protein